MRTDQDRKFKNISITVIFEGSALNRDENLSGNIRSIKKLRKNGMTFSFISKYAIRHYLFTTLVKAFNWKPAKVSVQKEVVQFDLSKDNVITSEELDVFGYMWTHSDTGLSLARKACIGITKAVSLEPYEGDMAFYANHDLVSRAAGYGATPNPYSGEEHTCLYKASFTIDTDRLGEDIWIFPSKIERDQEYLSINIKVDDSSRLVEIFYSTSEKKSSSDDKKTSSSQKRKETDRDEKARMVKHSQLNLLETESANNDIIVSDGQEKVSSESDTEQNISDAEGKKVIEKKVIGISLIEGVEVDGSNGIVRFTVPVDEKEKRLRAILEAIKNGLYAQSSGEVNTIVPLFMIAAPVKVPVPVFHPYIKVVATGKDMFEVIGIRDVMDNQWLDGKVFIKDSTSLKAKDKGLLGNITENWNEFLEEVGINICQTDHCGKIQLK